jgi:DNA polymerase III subunit delta'
MSFAQSAEQPSVELLRRSLQRGRLSHAYLFSGPLLGPLEAIARTLAKSLNCQSPPARGESGLPLDSCDACLSCRKIERENHPDVQWLRPESKSRVITIDQMRSLMQVINLKPTEAAWKVAVIVAADRLNVQAANAFLKTLEEPPQRSVLILLSTEPQRMLETILSRCLRLTFGGLETAPEVAPWLAEFSEAAALPQKGLLGRYRLLGLLLNRMAAVRSETDQQLTARSPLEQHDEVDPKLRERWEDELAAAIEAEYRRQRGEILLTLQWWLRDVWLQTLLTPEDLLTFPALSSQSRLVSQRISQDEGLHNLNVLERAQRLLSSNVQEALALEVSLLKLRL